MNFKRFCESVRWVTPKLKDEMDEFQLHSKTLGLDLSRLLEAAKKGRIATLDDKTWSTMKNTDSWRGVKPGDVKSAIAYAKRYGKDIESIMDGYKRGEDMPTPIVLLTDSGPYLIAGNTRLMAARALQDRPKVLLVSMK